ncbi:MAG: type IV pilin N-terminal domain-containing protein, partial [Candidatus Thermoplasmatota archaeon]|nr:type IV pilin N-terminal domain-containing protein [Candidatus Thermoplasmatota archaeon]
MKDVSSIVRHFKKKDISWALGVSEAVGTVLLLGISVALAGFVALWTSQIEEGEEGIYVDLWASVQGNDLVITHRGGDVLKGTGTFIVIRNEDGTEFLRNSYFTLTAPNDESWAPSEILTIDITGVSAGFDVIITTERPNGGQTVVLKNEMTRTNSAAGLPDLAITQVQLQNTNSLPVTRLNDDGLYFIFVRIDNFGADMTVQYFAKEA